jgi:hypothetical protein
LIEIYPDLLRFSIKNILINYFIKINFYFNKFIIIINTLFPVAITENLIENHVKLYIKPGEARGVCYRGVLYYVFYINKGSQFL